MLLLLMLNDSVEKSRLYDAMPVLFQGIYFISIWFVSSLYFLFLHCWRKQQCLMMTLNCLIIIFGVIIIIQVIQIIQLIQEKKAIIKIVFTNFQLASYGSAFRSTSNTKDSLLPDENSK